MQNKVKIDVCFRYDFAFLYNALNKNPRIRKIHFLPKTTERMRTIQVLNLEYKV